MNCREIVSCLQSNANPDNVAGMARFGISTVGTLGVNIPLLRELAEELIGMESRNARLIGKDALREFEKVRLKNSSK